MNISVLRILQVVILYFLTCNSDANAITTFSDRGAFESAAGQLDLEDFELVQQEISFLETPATVGNLTFSLSVIGQDFDFPQFNIVGPLPGSSETGVNGSSQALVAIGTTGSVDISIDRPVTAFGFDTRDFNDFGDTLVLVAGETIIPPTNPSTALTFFGVVSTTPFDTITFAFPDSFPGGSPNSPTDGDGFGIDNIAFSSSVVPEPSSAFLVAFTGLWVFQQRRR